MGTCGRSLPAYMVPAVFVALDALPLTSNNKVDRKQLPARSRSRRRAERRLPGTELQAQLVGIWCEVLGRTDIGIDDDFFDLGGHSLLATQIVSRIRAGLQVELPVRAVFEHPTVDALAEHVESAASGQRDVVHAPAIALVDRTRPLPLSGPQERMWFLQQLHPEGSAYNMAGALRRPRTPRRRCAVRRASTMWWRTTKSSEPSSWSMTASRCSGSSRRRASTCRCGTGARSWPASGSSGCWRRSRPRRPDRSSSTSCHWSALRAPRPRRRGPRPVHQHAPHHRRPVVERRPRPRPRRLLPGPLRRPGTDLPRAGLPVRRLRRAGTGSGSASGAIDAPARLLAPAAPGCHGPRAPGRPSPPGGAERQRAPPSSSRRPSASPTGSNP